MRKMRWVLLLLLGLSSSLWAQTSGPKPDNAGIYSVEEGITPPKLIRIAPPIYPADPHLAEFKHGCIVDVVIGADGKLRDVHLEGDPSDPFGSAAVTAVEESEFTPGLFQHKPVPIRFQVWVPFVPRDKLAVPEVMPINWKKPGKNNKPPVPLVSPQAEFTEEAKQANVQGTVLVSVLVTEQGLPENPHILRPLGYGLDQKALEAVMKYRFGPALRHGIPIPCYITVAMIFRRY